MPDKAKAGGAFIFFFQVCSNFDARTEPRLLLTRFGYDALFAELPTEVNARTETNK